MRPRTRVRRRSSLTNLTVQSAVRLLLQARATGNLGKNDEAIALALEEL